MKKVKKMMTMKITVIGLPGLKTERTINIAEEALSEFVIDGKLEWINDVHEMTIMGIYHTPAVLVNGKLKISGRIPSVYEITSWIEAELEEELAA